MNPFQQILLFAQAGLALSRAEDKERGEISTTTIIWAAALVLVAVAVSKVLVDKIQAKSDSISF
jgi:hypothetical protein